VAIRRIPRSREKGHAVAARCIVAAAAAARLGDPRDAEASPSSLARDVQRFPPRELRRARHAWLRAARRSSERGPSMPDIRLILCPVDFSPSSDKALDFALDLARPLGARVELVHVYQLPVYALPDGAVLAGPELVIRLSTELQKSLDALAARREDTKLGTHLVEGVPFREVTRLAEKLGADLIVMGTHGRTGLKHMLLGSVAERVVRASNVPVITVPKHD
jgi:nucleotide-binding universal stress UspA family protein